jgi:hypothetical protein
MDQAKAEANQDRRIRTAAIQTLARCKEWMLLGEERTKDGVLAHEAICGSTQTLARLIAAFLITHPDVAEQVLELIKATKNDLEGPPGT